MARCARSPPRRQAARVSCSQPARIPRSGAAATIALMARSGQGAARVKAALPWAALQRTAAVLGKRWAALTAKERGRLAGLVRASGGRPGNLSKRERKELRKLVRKLDLQGAARELAGMFRGRGRWRKRR